MPGDEVMAIPPVVPQWAFTPMQRPAIVQNTAATAETKTGNILRISHFLKGSTPSNTFILDMGMSFHVVNTPDLLSQFYPKPQSRTFHMAEGQSVFNVIGTRTLTIQCKTREQSIVLALRDVLVAPAIPVNVLSVAKFCEQNLVTVVFNDKYASFCRCEEIILPTISSPRIDHVEELTVVTSTLDCESLDKQSDASEGTSGYLFFKPGFFDSV